MSCFAQLSCFAIWQNRTFGQNRTFSSKYHGTKHSKICFVEPWKFNRLFVILIAPFYQIFRTNSGKKRNISVFRENLGKTLFWLFPKQDIWSKTGHLGKTGFFEEPNRVFLVKLRFLVSFSTTLLFDCFSKAYWRFKWGGQPNLEICPKKEIS